MPRRNREQVENYHDRVAGLYDAIYEGDPFWEFSAEITWRHLRRFLPRDQSARCLDVGCGTGRWGLKLWRSGYATDFLDISTGMLEQVDRKLRELGKEPTRIEAMPGADLRIVREVVAGAPAPVLHHASIDETESLPRGAYGLILGQGDPLCCARRPERALKGLCRALAPGGILMLSVDNRLAGTGHYLERGDVAGLGRFLRDGRTRWVTDRADEQYGMTMFTPADLRAACAVRGLELLSLIGKTVLPLRKHAALLKEKESRESLLRIEESLHAQEAMLGCAAHLEFVARKPAAAKEDEEAEDPASGKTPEQGEGDEKENR